MKETYSLIIGAHYTDERGTITFFNDFDMREVKRFYRIKQHDNSAVRGWRGHKVEQRWFQVCSGTFEVKLVKIDNWDSPSEFIKSVQVILKAELNAVLHIPAGFASSLRALSANSEIIVFSDYGIEHAKYDNYLFPPDYFKG